MEPVDDVGAGRQCHHPADDRGPDGAVHTFCGPGLFVGSLISTWWFVLGAWSVLGPSSVLSPWSLVLMLYGRCSCVLRTSDTPARTIRSWTKDQGPRTD